MISHHPLPPAFYPCPQPPFLFSAPTHTDVLRCGTGGPPLTCPCKARGWGWPRAPGDAPGDTPCPLRLAAATGFVTVHASVGWSVDPLCVTWRMGNRTLGWMEDADGGEHARGQRQRQRQGGKLPVVQQHVLVTTLSEAHYPSVVFFGHHALGACSAYFYGPVTWPGFEGHLSLAPAGTSRRPVWNIQAERKQGLLPPGRHCSGGAQS